MHGVNHKDRDTADWSISLKSNWWYLRIFYWLVDGILHAAYHIVCALAMNENHKWHKHLSKNGGRYKFEMDLGLALISHHGLGMDWKEGFHEEDKPKYVQRLKYIPCGCGRCSFCQNGKTHGVDHKPIEAKKKCHHKRVGQSPIKEKKKCPEQRSSLVKKSIYCKSCYWKLKEENKTWSSGEIKKNCKYSKMGCSVCEVVVCKQCWPKNLLH
jgi:hypothetical protein